RSVPATGVSEPALFKYSRDELLLTVTKYFRFTSEQCCKIVKLFAQQPLLRPFRLFVIFQNIRDGLIDNRQKQAPRSVRVKLFRLICHVGRDPSLNMRRRRITVS